MKLRDKYLMLKSTYHDCVILLKSGMFFILFDDDAWIVHDLFHYQVLNNKVGFPEKNLEKVVFRLQDEKIGYVIYWSEDQELEKYQIVSNQYYAFYENIKRWQFREEMNDLIIRRVKYLLEIDEKNYEKIRSFLDEF